MMSSSRRGNNFVTLGVIVSSTPKAALLAALQKLRSQLDIQLQQIAPVVGTADIGYRVEIRCNQAMITAPSIDEWLQVKSALMAQFPADKPGAVTTIDR